MPEKPSKEPPRQHTIMETDEDIRLAGPLGASVPQPVAKEQAKRDVAKVSSAALYRPTLRPPIAILTVLDDGKSDGEVIRLRAERFVIGRTEGDFLIPHDELMSGRHVEITRQQVGGQYRWIVTDLQTRNGLFIRVSRTHLADKAEFLVGKGRYRFEAPSSGQPNTVDYLAADAAAGSTRGWGIDAAANLQPLLVELLAEGIGGRVPLAKAEYWIGSDPACDFCRGHDPFVEPRHVRLSRDGNGVWTAQNNKSPNGLWFRVPQITVEEGCLFQIGEQRFRLRVEG